MRQFTYRFITGDETFSYSHTIGAPPAKADLPEWTLLEFNQCDGCQLKNSERCPVAVGLVEPAKLLGQLKSYEPITVEVTSPERRYHKDTTVQEGLSSMFGLIMATSGCPSFRYLRGLAHFHLPFATFEETLFRALSGYFVYHYVNGNELSDRDEMMDDIRSYYEQIKLTNLGITRRLREGAAPETDSPVNAIVILDSFGALVPMTAEDGLDHLREMFL